MVVFGEMGHFMPMSQLAHALIERGHEVHFLTNSDSYNGGKASKVLADIGCKNAIFTNDGVTRADLFKKPDGLKDQPENKFFPIWKKMWKEEIEKLKPELIVCDFFTRVGVEIGDELGIPSVINTPGLFNFMDEFAFSGVVNYEKDASVCCGMICVR